MKNLFVVSILFSAIGVTALISTSFTSQAQRVAAPASNDALLSRVQELEKKFEQLQKEMAGAKLVLSGIEKSLTNLKNAHESHSHRISAGLASFESVSTTQKAGQNPHIPVIYPNQLKADQAKYGAAGVFTTAPIKSNN